MDFEGKKPVLGVQKEGLINWERDFLSEKRFVSGEAGIRRFPIFWKSCIRGRYKSAFHRFSLSE
ncbi:MAG: hypothetical protein C4527_02760 [Candidatus Omnitrophota bacterium]|nr:MAG: hypothetical protein C4527_02760 [Candidatus Omnitrophota bacterium]